MENEYILSYTAEEIDQKLAKVDKLDNADWYAKNGQPGYINNKPASLQIDKCSIYLEGSLEEGYAKSTPIHFDFYRMSDIDMTLNINPKIIELDKCYDSLTSLMASAEDLSVGEYGVFFIKGSVFYLSTTSFFIVLVRRIGEGEGEGEFDIQPLLVSTDSASSYNGIEFSKGVYYFETSEGVRLTKLEFNYKTILLNQDFSEIFKAPTAVNIYPIDFEALISSVSEGAVSGLIAELGKYDKGDILVVPTALLGMIGGGE